MRRIANGRAEKIPRRRGRSSFVAPELLAGWASLAVGLRSGAERVGTELWGHGYVCAAGCRARGVGMIPRLFGAQRVTRSRIICWFSHRKAS